jgi:iron complex outermembrane receptor protein
MVRLNMLGRGMDGSQFARESLGLRFEKKNVTDVIKKIEAQVNYSYNDHIMDNYSLRTPPLVEMSHGGMTMLMPNPMAMQVTRRTLNSRLAMTSEWDQWSLITGSILSLINMVAVCHRRPCHR